MPPHLAAVGAKSLTKPETLRADRRRLVFSRCLPILAAIMMRLFRSLVMFLTLLGLSAGGMWDVANAHQGKVHAPQTQGMEHHHAAKVDQGGDHSERHRHQAVQTKLCLDTSSPCGGDMPDHMGGTCCAAMTCHMAVLPQISLDASAVAIEAVNPLPLETDVEGTIGPRLERPPRLLVA